MTTEKNMVKNANPTDHIDYLLPSTCVGIDMHEIYAFILPFLRGTFSAMELKWMGSMNTLNIVSIELINNLHLFFFFYLNTHRIDAKREQTRGM